MVDIATLGEENSGRFPGALSIALKVS